MANRNKLVAGNWKMNGLRQDGSALARDLVQRTVAQPPSCDLLVCPPAILLPEIAGILAGSGIALGGQDCHPAAKGAHTGDISAEMLADAGCSHVILGHSERRRDHGEGDTLIRAKIAAAWRAGLVAILCVGETREQREAGAAAAIVAAQLAGAIPEGADAGRLVVAYEPVWAIGTGLTPTADDIARMHADIRARLPAAVRILYGGSVNPGNAAEILALAEVDGALVGGASLDAGQFCAIAACCG
ncbi:MAG TPA: triose-phosphate isomerase [Stellaceae bacterium]|nr:triose-phosphate isomerase [Stellaceae bacterium]